MCVVVLWERVEVWWALSGGLLLRARGVILVGGRGRREIRGGGMGMFVGSRRRVGRVCMLMVVTVALWSACDRVDVSCINEGAGHTIVRPLCFNGCIRVVFAATRGL